MPVCGNIDIGDIQHWITRHEGSRMPVRPEVQMDEVEHRRIARDCPESIGISNGGGREIGQFHGHGVNMFRPQRRHPRKEGSRGDA